MLHFHFIFFVLEEYSMLMLPVCLILFQIMHGLDDSVTVLEHYVENMKDALMPSIQSIGSVRDMSDSISHDWSQGIKISYREMACQVRIRYLL